MFTKWRRFGVPTGDSLRVGSNASQRAGRSGNPAVAENLASDPRTVLGRHSSGAGGQDAAELVGEQHGDLSLFQGGSHHTGGGREPIVTTGHSAGPHR